MGVPSKQGVLHRDGMTNAIEVQEESWAHVDGSKCVDTRTAVYADRGG